MKKTPKHIKAMIRGLKEEYSVPEIVDILEVEANFIITKPTVYGIINTEN